MNVKLRFARLTYSVFFPYSLAKKAKYQPLDRLALSVDGARVQVCKPSQLKGAEEGIVCPPLVSSTDTTGAIKNDLYTNMLDMLAMSQYVYEIAELRRIAQTKQLPDLQQALDIAIDKPKSFGELHDILKNNLPVM